MNDVNYILQKIKKIILGMEPTAKIYLYCSRARGLAQPDSDWDLLILLNKEKITFDVEDNITYPLYDFEYEIGEVISPMIYSELECDSKYRITPFYKTVMREGKLL